ncbi:hypothetical protein BAUCODRAFT_32193 [Baudoinia panamericana UAMH 10762]|uniref:Uncharacterized protein n=1 Tax=Baudoinia panamericana (strain UAMH 10762) TaxID=717646 RepID=M2MND4_BAUPA|nr:uncharacterized protein BAUCODRAFT_32193 [Baudoinia panamericana UAMH 10762]EMC98196.1 hypothetical protein BAUCODRAFT_32193 [Baudoinia panamericana UAMH 10762]
MERSDHANLEIANVTEGQYPPTHTPETSPSERGNSVTTPPRLAAFTFPTLSPDGSVDNISTLPTRTSYHTPPAALSSLAMRLKSVDDDQASEASSFADHQYDMLDDLSELSSDGQDTASLGSAGHTDSDDGQFTPEGNDTTRDQTDDEQRADVETALAESAVFVESSDSTSQQTPPGKATSYEIDSSQDHVKWLSDHIDSELSETPTQSTIQAWQPLGSANKNISGSARVSSSSSPNSVLSPLKWADMVGEPQIQKPSMLKSWMLASAGKTAYALLISTIVVFLLQAVFKRIELSRGLFLAQVDIQAQNRETLARCLIRTFNRTDITKTVNISHLLPMPTAMSQDIFGKPLYILPDEVYTAAAAPNHLIVSLPSRSRFRGPRKLESVRTFTAKREVTNTFTKVMDGIYNVMVDPAEAHGIVSFEAQMACPQGPFSVQHDFGRKMLQRQTYEKVRRDLSKSVSKEVTEARKHAASLQELFQSEFAAGAAATRNVTTALALQMTRELQVFVGTATSVLNKLNDMGNRSMVALSKDLASVQSDIAGLGKAMGRSLQVSKEAASKKMGSSLKVSRERALKLKDRIFDSKKDSTSTSSSTALSRFRSPIDAARIANKFEGLSYLRPKPKVNSLSMVTGQDLRTHEPASNKPSLGDASRRKTAREANGAKIAALPVGKERVKHAEDNSPNPGKKSTNEVKRAGEGPKVAPIVVL